MLMKRVLFCLICLIFCFSFSAPCVADNIVLKTGISLDEMVPDVFFGAWRIKSKLLETNSDGYFKKDSVDLWNISKHNGVITLDNPFSGARASISIKEVSGNKVVFEKNDSYNNQKLLDVVELYIDKNSFYGYNYLKLTTVSDIDGRILESKTAKYSLNGDKISGDNVFVEE